MSIMDKVIKAGEKKIMGNFSEVSRLVQLRKDLKKVISGRVDKSDDKILKKAWKDIVKAEDDLNVAVYGSKK